LGCNNCKNPICPTQLAFVIYNLGVLQPQLKPMLYDFQGTFSRLDADFNEFSEIRGGVSNFSAKSFERDLSCDSRRKKLKF